MPEERTFEVNRFEVIDHCAKGSEDIGRVFVKWWDEGKFNVECMLQDDGRTLKVFITEKKD